MADTTTEEGAELDALQTVSGNKILNAINKGFDNMAKVVDYCGPELIDERRTGSESEMDVPAALRTIDRLVDEGYIERGGRRFPRQLNLKLTERGKEAAPELSETERELISEHEVTLDALRVLSQVIEYRESYGKSPFMEQLINEFDIDLLAHQVTVLFGQIVDAGLAEEKGIFRYSIVPNDEGRQLVQEYEDEL